MKTPNTKLEKGTRLPPAPAYPPPPVAPPIFQQLIPFRVYEDLRHDLMDLREQIKRLGDEKMELLACLTEERAKKRAKK